MLLSASTFFCALATSLSLKCHYHESLTTFLPDIGQVGPTQVLIEDSVTECSSKDSKYCLSLTVSNVDENTDMEMRLIFRGCNGDPKYGVMKDDPASVIDLCTKNGIAQDVHQTDVKGRVDCCDKDACNDPSADALPTTGQPGDQSKAVAALRANLGLALGVVAVVGMLKLTL